MPNPSIPTGKKRGAAVSAPEESTPEQNAGTGQATTIFASMEPPAQANPAPPEPASGTSVSTAPPVATPRPSAPPKALTPEETQTEEAFREFTEVQLDVEPILAGTYQEYRGKFDVMKRVVHLNRLAQLSKNPSLPTHERGEVAVWHHGIQVFCDQIILDATIKCANNPDYVGDHNALMNPGGGSLLQNEDLEATLQAFTGQEPNFKNLYGPEAETKATEILRVLRAEKASREAAKASVPPPVVIPAPVAPPSVAQSPAALPSVMVAANDNTSQVLPPATAGAVTVMLDATKSDVKKPFMDTDPREPSVEDTLDILRKASSPGLWVAGIAGLLVVVIIVWTLVAVITTPSPAVVGIRPRINHDAATPNAPSVPVAQPAATDTQELPPERPAAPDPTPTPAPSTTPQPSQPEGPACLSRGSNLERGECCISAADRTGVDPATFRPDPTYRGHGHYVCRARAPHQNSDGTFDVSSCNWCEPAE